MNSKLTVIKNGIIYKRKELIYFYKGVKIIHYKGGLYTILGQGTHSETGEDVIIYQNDADNRIWVRPLTMFHDLVEYKGDVVNRFDALDYVCKVDDLKEDLPRYYQ